MRWTVAVAIIVTGVASLAGPTQAAVPADAVRTGRVLYMVATDADGGELLMRPDGRDTRPWDVTRAARRDVVRVVEPNGSVVRVGLGHGLRPRDPSLVSVANANDRFRLTVTLDRFQRAVWPYLVAGGEVIASRGVSEAPGAWRASFEVAPSVADALAAAWGVPRRDRADLAVGVDARFSWAEEAAGLGGTAPVRLVVTNHGPRDLVVFVGGRSRNRLFRDNTFAFRATCVGSPEPPWRACDGEPVALIDAPDDGGPGGFVALPRGGELALTADVAQWAAFAHPGAYRVEARYDLTLGTATAAAMEPGHEAELWEVAVSQTLTLELGAP